MKATSRILVVVAAAGLLAVAATPAFAQANLPARRTGGLFANVPPSTTDSQSLNLSATLVEVYDDDVLSEGGSHISRQNAPMSGFYSMVTTDANYSWRGRRAQIGVTGLSALRYYGAAQTVRVSSTSVGAGFSVNMSPRTNWSFNQSAAYLPSYFYGLFPTGSGAPEPGDLPDTAAPNYTLDNQQSYFYGASTTLGHKFTNRNTLSVSADGGYTDFQRPSPGMTDRGTYGLRTEFSRNISRNNFLRVGYRYRRGDTGFSGNRPTSEQGVDAGLEIARPLSATRKATLAFAVGSSALEVPTVLVSGATAPGISRLYRLTANVMAGYQFGRTWQARGTYWRGLEYVPILTTPVFIDATSASLEGLFTRRFDISVSGGYSSGNSALTNNSSVNTYTGDLRLRYAVTRNWAVFAEYLYYFYDFRGSSLLLSPGIAPGLERNGIRAGLTLWVPTLGR